MGLTQIEIENRMGGGGETKEDVSQKGNSKIAETPPQISLPILYDPLQNDTAKH